MKVLTFGWDFPPHTTGGLGAACLGLTRELARDGVEVIFVLPKSQPVTGTNHFRFADVERMVQMREVTSGVQPYQSSQSLMTIYDEFGRAKYFNRTLLQEVHAYAHKAAQIALEENFEIIHAHDWTAYLAGVAAKKATGKPLILHVHATSYDQAASDNVDPEVFHIECEAFEEADTIITVSQFTKDLIVTKHGVNPEKVAVIHNGCDAYEKKEHAPTLEEVRAQGKKIVLYHGRITVQKGVDYFVSAARRVLDAEPNVVFVVSGSGDMMGQILQQVGSLGLSSHFIFAGALWGDERDRMYQSVDLVVMPSVSEPFGLVPLEAMQHGTPSLISKQSGVNEVVTHALKVDFWDVEEMANKIIAALKYPVLNQQLVNEGTRELSRLAWNKAAGKVKTLYKSLLQLVS